MKVLISDHLSDSAISIFKNKAIRSNTNVDKEILLLSSNLKVVGRAGIGVDNIDIDYATSKGIIVMNTPHGNSITTAEHTIAMIMSLARQIPDANVSTKKGKWEKSKFVGTEITS